MIMKSCPKPTLARLSFAGPILAKLIFAGPILAKLIFAGLTLAMPALAGRTFAELTLAWLTLAGRTFAELTLAWLTLAERAFAELTLTEPTLAGPTFAGPTFVGPTLTGLTLAERAFAGLSSWLVIVPSFCKLKEHIIMFKRPTSFADAFVSAVVKTTKAEKVDHTTGQGNWIARRVILNAERPGFGMVTEYDKRPVPTHKSDTDISASLLDSEDTID
jgi:hypothetical protein